MRRLFTPLVLLILLFVACQQPTPLDPWVSFAQQNWDGFSASGSKTVSIGWCVSGEFKGQEAAIWIIPNAGSYLIKRQYLATTECKLPDLPYDKLLG